MTFFIHGNKGITYWCIVSVKHQQTGEPGNSCNLLPLFSEGVSLMHLMMPTFPEYITHNYFMLGTSSIWKHHMHKQEVYVWVCSTIIKTNPVILSLGAQTQPWLWIITGHSSSVTHKDSWWHLTMNIHCETVFPISIYGLIWKPSQQGCRLMHDTSHFYSP